jgi:hypothetical protein
MLRVAYTCALLGCVAGPLLIACASSQSAAAPLDAHAAPATSAVPADPLELVVGEPSAWLDAHVDQLRASPVYARLRPMIERATCARSSDLDWLAHSATRAIVATREQANAAPAQWLLVLVGNFTQADADRLLSAAAQRARSGAAPSPSASRAVGRFTLSEQAQLGASLLEAHVIVLGAVDWVQAALASLAHPMPSLAGSALRRELSGALRCSERSLCMLASKDSQASKEFQRTLSSAGAKALGRQLAAADTALSLALPDSVELTFLARLPSAEIAEASMRQAKDLLWQAGLLIRLAGLPDILDAARLQANTNLLQAELSVSAADLAQYEQRLSGLLAGSESACAESPEAPPQ